MHFDFVTEQGSRNRHRDQATKLLIRKRATQAAALTKRKEGTIRRSNPLQPSPWVINERAWSTDNKGRRTAKKSDATVQFQAANLTIINNIQTNTHYYARVGPEAAGQSPVRSLSPIIYTESIPSLLATPAVQAHLVGSLLSRFPLAKDHIRIGKLLKLSDSEFLLQLSYKYGQSAALDAAIICLAARIKEFLNAPVQIESPRYLYGRALQTLQQSLCNESTEDMENLWYATPTLALFELLDASSNTPWVLHAKAAAKMLKQFGAGNIHTEAQKTLLATQTPIIIIEALTSAGSCFLDEPEWQLALQNNVTEGPLFYYRSVMIVQLFLFAAKIPNLFNKVTDAVRTSTTSVTPDLQRRLLDLKSLSATWNARWKDILNHRYDESQIEAARLFHRANSYGYAAIIDRLLLALDTSQCLDLEIAAVHHARQAANVTDLSCSVRLAYARVMSESIIKTSAEWQQHCMFSRVPLVSKAVFLNWARSMERPVEAAPG